MTDFDPQSLWQSQTEETVPMTLDQLQTRARRFDRTISRRNLIEYAAVVFVVIAFAAIAAMGGEVLIRVGAISVAVGALIVAWQLRRRASVQPPSAVLGAAPVAQAYRDALSRQRDALASVWVWYLLPLLPGLVLMSWGRWSTLLATLAVFGGIGWLNTHAARRLDRKVQALDAARSQTG